jgi:hypothetical protein
MMRLGHLWLTVLLLIASGTGCAHLRLGKKKPMPRPFVPPPVVVRTIPQQPLIIGDPPPNPGLFADIAFIPYPPFGKELELPERPKPPAPKPRPSPPPATTTETPPEPTPPPVPVPKLTQILTESQVKQYRADYDEAAGSAERILESAARRSLNLAQTESVQQVRNFLRQAQEQRDTDLSAARNLARRAAILARDLQTTLR